MAACRPPLHLALISPDRLELLMHNSQQTTINSVQAYQSLCSKSNVTVNFAELAKLLKVGCGVVSTYRCASDKAELNTYQVTHTKVTLLDQITWNQRTQELSICRNDHVSHSLSHEAWIKQQILLRPSYNLSGLGEILRWRGVSDHQIKAAMFYQIKAVEIEHLDYVDQLLRLFNLCTGLIDYSEYVDQLTSRADMCTVYQFSEQLESKLIAAINSDAACLSLQD